MKVEETVFKNCYIITPEIFKDFRGEYIEIFNQEEFDKKVLPIKFVQDDISISTKGVLRGFHGDQETWKLIQCLHGKFQFVVIDYDKESPTYMTSLDIILDDKTRQQLLVPPKFGNAHLCLSDSCIFHYKQTSYYVGAEKQFTIPWNVYDDWAIKNPILSERDRKAKLYE